MKKKRLFSEAGVSFYRKSIEITIKKIKPETKKEASPNVFLRAFISEIPMIMNIHTSESCM